MSCCGGDGEMLEVVVLPRIALSDKWALN